MSIASRLALLVVPAFLATVAGCSGADASDNLGVCICGAEGRNAVYWSIYI